MNKSLKKLLVMLMVMTLTLSFVGCTKSKDANDKSNAQTPSVENTTGDDATSNGSDDATTSKDSDTTANESATSEVTYPVTITDSYGKEITLNEEPKKVISVAPNMTELIYALGAEGKLVGRTDYCDYPTQVSEIESIGKMSDPSIEKITSLEPDVVLVSTHFTDENRAKLEDLGIKVIGLYEEHEVSGVYTMIETLGTVLNHQKEATTVVTDMKTKVDDVTAKVADLKAPTVYYVVWYGEGADSTAGGDTFIGKMLTMAGGDNIAKDVKGWSYSLESLVEADPEYIILADYLKDDFVKADGYKDLTAVKEGRVFGINENFLVRQGNRNADGLVELAKILHPEAFK